MKYLLKSTKYYLGKALWTVFMCLLLKTGVQAQPCTGLTFNLVSVSPGNPTFFEWYDQCNTEVFNYELQILRLYNVNPLKNADNDITAKIDWSQATTIYTERPVNPALGNTREIYLTLAEGTGYYAWRMRRIYGYGYNAPGLPWNFGPWTNTGALFNGAQVNINATYDASNLFVFYYHQFNEQMNWIYRRSFGDSRGEHISAPRINEKIDFANFLLMPIQHQEMYGWFGSPTVSQTVIDHSGRPAFTSMKAKSGGWISYRADFLQSSNTGQAYTANDYDNNNNYNNPADVNGELSDYYSDNNPDKRIPSALGKPFSRTLYWNDGLNRPREIVTPGFVHASDPANDPDNSSAETIRKAYSKASHQELIRMFGDEAPKGEYVDKTTTIDPNGGYSVEYRDEMDRVIATSLTTPSAPSMDNIRIPATNEVSIVDTIRTITQVAPDKILLKGTYSFSQPTSLNYFFHLQTNLFGDTCLGICSSCDYKVTINGIDRDDTSGFKLVRYVYPKIDSLSHSGCGSGFVFDTSGVYDIPSNPIAPGTYDVTVLLEPNLPNPLTGKTFLDSVVSVMRRKLDTIVYKGTSIVGGYPGNMQVIMAMLDSNNINGVMNMWHVDTTKTTFEVSFIPQCIRINVPVLYCQTENCSPPAFAKYMKDALQKNDQETGTTYFSGAYANTGTGGIAFTTHASNLFVVASDAEFNNIISNMITDGYNCDNLWEAWRNTVHTFIRSQKMLTPGVSVMLSSSPKVDWWDYFMKEVGYKIALTQRPFSELGTNTVTSSTLVRTKPYRYFPYNWTSNMTMENLYCFLGTNNSPCASPSTSATTPGAWVSSINNFPSSNPAQQPFHMYNFYKSIKGGLSPNIFPGTVNKGNHGGQVMNTIKNICVESCNDRLNTLITTTAKHYMDQWTMTVEGFTYDAWRPTPVGNVPLDRVLCITSRVVEACKSKCDVTPDSSGYLSSIKLSTIRKAMTAPIEVYSIPGATPGSCPVGFENVALPTAPFNRRIALQQWMNYKQRMLRDSLNQVGVMNYTWDPLAIGGTLVTSPMLSAPCTNFDIQLKHTDSNVSFDYGRVRNTVNLSCSSKVATITRTTIDTIFINSEMKVNVRVKFNTAVAANDSVRVVETVPAGFTLVSAAGNVVSGKILYTISGPRLAGSYEDVTYTLRAPSTGTTSTINGTLLSYVSGIAVDSCVLNNTSIRADSCVSLYSIVKVHFDSSTELVCKVCYEAIACRAPTCMRFVELPVLNDTTIPPPSCSQYLSQRFKEAFHTAVDSYFSAKEVNLRDAYYKRCINPDSVDVFLAHDYRMDNYAHTLYYYDRAGNLIRTVQRGTAAMDNPSTMSIPTDRTANPLVNNPTATVWNEYDYSTTGRLMRSETRDGGETRYWYDKVGRLRLSQNAKQIVTGGGANVYSYTKYDALGRVIESGEMDFDMSLNANGSNVPDQMFIDNIAFPSLSFGATALRDVTFTVYSEPYPTGTGFYPNGSTLNGVVLFPSNGGTLDGPTPYPWPNTWASPNVLLNYGIDTAQYQHHIRNRVSYTIQDKNGIINTGMDQDRIINVYSYDPYGNVDFYYTYIPGMSKVRLVRYDNMITEGKPLFTELVDINRLPDPADNIVYKFGYNPDGIMDGAFRGYHYLRSGRPGTRYTDFDRGFEQNSNVNYFYNPHDYSLRRVQLGNDLQGIDYTYTLEGWLKAINHPDPAKDQGSDYEYYPTFPVPGADGVGASNFRKDAFSEILHYYNGDFTRATSPYNTYPYGGYPANPELLRFSPGRQLLGGEITAAQSYIRSQPIGGSPNRFKQEMGYRYEYDQLSRLKYAHSTHLNGSTWIANNTTTPGIRNEQYSESVQYGTYGITMIGRGAANPAASEGTAAPVTIDVAQYTRALGTNKVTQILDAGGTGKDVSGLDVPNQTNIGYDQIGNINYMQVANYDKKEPPAVNDTFESYKLYVDWNVQNKIAKVRKENLRTNTVDEYEYLYDAQGNRARERHLAGNMSSVTPVDLTFYIRSADGKEIAIYEDQTPGANPPPVVSERYVYGLDRLGFVSGPNVPGTSTAWMLPFMNYEIKDHSGNVRLTIPENPSAIFPNEPEAITSTNYYAFGGVQPYRNYNMANYRMGFNGQERNDALMGLGKFNTAKFWGYNPHLALRWNMDPVLDVENGPYAVFGNNPINNVDPDGDLFFGLFGSTSHQRQAAKSYAAIHGGEVKGLLKKSISVEYTEGRTYIDPGSTGGWGVESVNRNQHFNLDGSLFYSGAAFRQHTPGLMENWSRNNSFLGQVSYGIADGFYVTGQNLITKNIIGDGRAYHIGGGSTSATENINSFATATAFFIPVGAGANGSAHVGRVFWSGGGVAKNAAEAYARANGLTTLEMTTRGRILTVLDKMLPDRIKQATWDYLSNNFAKGAKGEAHVFHNMQGVRLESVWKTTEYPILQKNHIELIFHNVK